MSRLSEKFDGDEEVGGYTDAAFGASRFELICSECGRAVFTDKDARDRIVEAMEINPDNQFVCDSCVRADQEAGYQAN